MPHQHHGSQKEKTRQLVALTLRVWVGVLSTLLPKCSTVELKFVQIKMFFTCRIHLDASLRPFFGVNGIFQCSWHVIWKFRTTFSVSSQCSFQLRIAQNSSLLVKSKCIFRLFFDHKWFASHFQKLTLSRPPTRWGCLEAPKKCTIRKYLGECFWNGKFTSKDN